MSLWAVRIAYGQWVPDPARKNCKIFDEADGGGWLGKDGASLSDEPVPLKEWVALLLVHAVNHWWRDLEDLPQDILASAVQVHA